MNMSTLKLIIVLSAGLLLAACGQSSQTAPSNSEGSAAEPTSAPKQGCLMEYRTKTCDLISSDVIAEIIGLPGSEISVRDNSNVLQSSPELIACLFETPGSTKQGTITVGQIQIDDSGVFKTKYNNEYYSQPGRKASYLDEPVGDASVFLQIGSNTSLIVLLGNEQFSVQLYGNSRSEEENLQIAKRVALQVLQKCK